MGNPLTMPPEEAWSDIRAKTRRERRRQSSTRRIPSEVAQAARARDGKVCVYCGWRPGVGGTFSPAAGKLVYDHLIPASVGGPGGDPRNVVVACDLCNASKGDTSPLVWLLAIRRRKRSWSVPGYVWDLAIEICKERLMGQETKAVGATT